ncbi:hypothetical protein J2046_003010 [Rhizobium petrolearium]|uniref:HEPN domain-containing protein n=1 Tax=Neorhizobium petrolearium TaxID=515361 RepID=UPI001AE573B6|nr:HEPN domain-containing protein [Neorhizobium petrolearium]MBP1844743.1 hypothetical protein [Neorhizobium petrolearium]
MPIDLHEKFRLSLLNKLRPLAEAIRYNSGTYIDRVTIYPLHNLDRDIKRRKELAEPLSEFIGDTPLYHFVSEHLSQLLRDNYDYSNQSGLVSELPLFSGLDPAEYLVTAFESLPWHYTVSFVLPAAFDVLLPQNTDERVLSNSIRLLRVTDKVQDLYPLESGIERRDKSTPLSLMGLMGLMDAPKESLPLGRILFQTQVKGFIGVFDRSTPLRLAEARLKAFLGFLLADYTLEVSFLYVPTVPKSELVIHQGIDADWQYLRRHELDEDFKQLLPKLGINKTITREDKSSEGLLEEWVNLGCQRACAGFQDNKAARRLQLAATWLFDSYANNRDLLAFVQAMVSMEILLGEKEDEEVGIGSMLRNRCAFLIGRSHNEREEIIDQLKQIYQVRSKIVHTGKDRLTRDEVGMLFQLRHYCGRVIERELEIATETK